ncbi:polar amino acid transport system permease protein [Methylobacterium sp. ap11]|nr:polar amino acid transport system permease protein [Methylobacterium sp. ap11]
MLRDAARLDRARRTGGSDHVNYTLDFGPVVVGLPDLLKGCAGTLLLAVAGMAIALVIGVVGVVLRESPLRPLRWAVIAFVELIRNTPFLVQIYFVFFALPLIGIRLAPTPTAIIALGLNGGAYAIEIIRGGVQSIHKGQVEAGFALGLHKRDVFRFIVLRPALRAVYPSLTGQFVMLTLTTSIASAIAAYELTSVAKLIENESFRSFEVYGTITILYFLMSWLMMRAFGLVSRRYFSYPVK